MNIRMSDGEVSLFQHIAYTLDKWRMSRENVRCEWYKHTASHSNKHCLQN